MEYSSYRKPYSHRTRFKLVHSTTTLVKVSKTTTAAATPTSRFKLVRNGTKTTQPVLNSSKTSLLRVKNAEKSSTALAKNIGNKYKWMRTSLRKTDRNRFRIILEHS